MTQASLYHYTKEFLEVKNALDNMEHNEDAYIDTLDSFKELIIDKAEDVIKYRNELLALAKAQKEEANRMLEASKKKEQKADTILGYLDNTMRNLELTELKAGNFVLDYKKGSERTLVDEKLLPKEYWVPQEPKPMGKDELKKLVKAGTEIEGVKVVRGPDTLRVKL